MVRLGNIGNGAWVDQDAVFIPLDYWRTLSQHHALPGDLLIAGLGDENHPLGRACVMPDLGPAMVKADCYRLRLERSKVDPRFAALYLSSTAGGAEALRLADGATRSRLTLGKALSIPFPDIPIDDQRAIAEYLDAETARIDAVVASRTRQRDLARARTSAYVASLLQRDEPERVALRRVVELVPGFAYRSEDFLPDEGDVRLLRGINVDVGSVRWDDVVWVNNAVARATEGFTLAAGDIVMGMDRPVINSGVRVARVQQSDLPAMLVQRVARLRARQGVRQDYLAAVLMGPGLAEHFGPMFTGVSVPHVSPSQILSYEIPLPREERQDEIVREVEIAGAWQQGFDAAAGRQIDLLLERRRALITAAVTGQLDIPGAT